MKILALLSAVAVAVLAVLAVLAMPRPPRLGPETTGDAALARSVRQAAGDGAGHRGMSVALIEGGRVRFAGVGDSGGPVPRPVGPDTPYEVGSIPKVMTGMLLADLAEEGLSPDTPVRDLLPGLSGATGSVTLAELASHRSGLPRLRTTPLMLARAALGSYTGADPYAGAGPQDVLADAAAVSPDGKRGEVAYSNLGMALLGLALADHANAPRSPGGGYAALLRTRLLEPLGMSATTVLGPRDPLPAGHASGQGENGMPMDPWRDHGYAGAGGATWSTAADVARLVQATMNATAPGSAAATPRFTDSGDRRIGYGWFTDKHGHREITWHNGATGGFSAYAGFDRAAGRGVVVLANTSRSVDAVGLRLLGVAAPDEDTPPVQLLAVTVLFTLSGVPLLVATATAVRRARRAEGPGEAAPAPPRALDRVSLVGRALWAALFLWLAHNAGLWTLVPPVAWSAGVVVLGVALALGLTVWPALPRSRTSSAWQAAFSVGLPAALLAAYGLAVAA
ncbi:serine hydrolase domain-containing protein [Nonomuraea sp. NPDC047897]|uniref:serine hydrolase domain-containing protein n=1 Tax=Nonomuraea sp. NPDC047897 TaxID=3364346 RepID=UPI00371A800E